MNGSEADTYKYQNFREMPEVTIEDINAKWKCIVAESEDYRGEIRKCEEKIAQFRAQIEINHTHQSHLAKKTQELMGVKPTFTNLSQS